MRANRVVGGVARSSVVLSLSSEEVLLASVVSRAGGGASSDSTGSTGDSGVSAVVVSTGLLNVVRPSDGGSGELSGRQLKGGEVESGEHEEVEDGVDGLGEEIEDTVEDHLGIRRDDVGTVGETPSDGVEEPEEGEESGRAGEGSSVACAEDAGGLSGGTSKQPPDVEEGGASKGVETPLVGRLDEGSDETGDDHDQVEEDEGDDVRQGETRSENEHEQQGGLTVSMGTTAMKASS
jgi:hypothetical protein